MAPMPCKGPLAGSSQPHRLEPMLCLLQPQGAGLRGSGGTLTPTLTSHWRASTDDSGVGPHLPAAPSRAWWPENLATQSTTLRKKKSLKPWVEKLGHSAGKRTWGPVLMRKGVFYQIRGTQNNVLLGVLCISNTCLNLSVSLLYTKDKYK